jgi:hypothetical protein
VASRQLPLVGRQLVIVGALGFRGAAATFD